MSGVIVRIPTILRTYTSGEAEVTIEGAENLGQVLDRLEDAYPGIKTRVVDDAGVPRRFVNIYVGDEDVRFEDGLDTATPAGTHVSIIPAVAGG